MSERAVSADKKAPRRPDGRPGAWRGLLQAGENGLGRAVMAVVRHSADGRRLHLRGGVPHGDGTASPPGASPGRWRCPPRRRSRSQGDAPHQGEEGQGAALVHPGRGPARSRGHWRQSADTPGSARQFLQGVAGLASSPRAPWSAAAPCSCQIGPRDPARHHGGGSGRWGRGRCAGKGFLGRRGPPRSPPRQRSSARSPGPGTAPAPGGPISSGMSQRRRCLPARTPSTTAAPPRQESQRCRSPPPRRTKPPPGSERPVFSTTSHPRRPGPGCMASLRRLGDPARRVQQGPVQVQRDQIDYSHEAPSFCLLEQAGTAPAGYVRIAGGSAELRLTLSPVAGQHETRNATIGHPQLPPDGKQGPLRCCSSPWPGWTPPPRRGHTAG